MKKKVKIIVGAIIAVGVLAAIALSKMSPMSVAAVTVEPKEAYAYFIEDGTIIGGADFMLYPEVSGAVLNVMVKKGDYVNNGDVIMEIDRAEYERQIIAHQAAIEGYNAQIASAREGEQNVKDEYTASIAALRTQISQIEAQRKSAEAARISTPSANEQLELLQVSIDKTKTDIALSENNLSKTQLLYETGAVSKAELDEAKNALEASYAELRQYETEYAQASGKTAAGDLAKSGETELYASQKRAANEQIAELTKNIEKDYSGTTVKYYLSLIEAEEQAIKSAASQLEKCMVLSPISGYVSEIPAEGLSAASPQTLAAVIKTEAEARIESYVSTKDIGILNAGAEVELVIKGRDEDKTITGKIEEISKWAETKVSALGLDEKKVRVVISASGAELIPGADLDVRYAVYRQQNKILVPTSAIFSSGGGDYVFTINGGKAVKTQITKGVKTLTETVVESGLKSGDTVISEANTSGLTEGTRVKAQ